MEPKRKHILIVGAHSRALAIGMAQIAIARKTVVMVAEREKQEYLKQKRRILETFDRVATIDMPKTVEDLGRLAQQAKNSLSSVVSIIDDRPVRLKHHNYWPLAKKQGGRKHKKHRRV